MAYYILHINNCYFGPGASYFCWMEFLERLVDALPDAVCVVDSISKKIKYFNKTFSTQLLAGDHLIGADFAHEVLNFEDTEKYDNAFEAALSKYEDVTVGFCKSLSHVGPEKCKLYYYNFELNNLLKFDEFNKLSYTLIVKLTRSP